MCWSWFCGTRSRSSAAHGPTAARACGLHSGGGTLYNWSGFYVGGNLGAGWNSGGSVSDTFGSTFSGSGQTTKFLGGGQVGVNYEFCGGVVVGAEAMFDWLPNTTNTFTATQGPPARFLVPCLGDVQQSMADYRDRQTRLCMGPCAALR